MFDQIITYLQESLLQNEFFQGGFVLGGMALVVRYAGTVANRIRDIIGYYTSIHVEMQDHCESFDWVARYTIDLFQHRNTGRFYLLNVKDRKGDNANNGLVPFGSRWMWIGWCLARISLSKRDLENGQSKSVEYTISLSFYGLGKKKVLEKILNESKRLYGPSDNKLNIMRATGDWWDYMGTMRPRSLESIYSNKLQLILDDLKMFQESESKYREKGIPYRRGYLLHGPPGTGKTITVKAMAAFLKRDLRILNLKGGLQLDSLMSGNKKLIMIEDIDATSKNVNKRTKDEDGAEGSGPTLSDILNAIDGVATGHDIIFVFTTNHPDKLDPALLRPGRVDVEVELTYMTQPEFEMACKNLYGEKPNMVIRDGVTPATCQKVFLEHQDNFEAFIERLTDAKLSNMES